MPHGTGIRELTRAMRDTSGNRPPLPAIYPDSMAKAEGRPDLIIELFERQIVRGRAEDANGDDADDHGAPDEDRDGWDASG